MADKWEQAATPVDKWEKAATPVDKWEQQATPAGPSVQGMGELGALPGAPPRRLPNELSAAPAYSAQFLRDLGADVPEGYEDPPSRLKTAAHILASPATGVLGIPGQVQEWMEDKRMPSGGVFGEEPVTQAYNNALFALHTGFGETKPQVVHKPTFSSDAAKPTGFGRVTAGVKGGGKAVLNAKSVGTGGMGYLIGKGAEAATGIPGLGWAGAILGNLPAIWRGVVEGGEAAAPKSGYEVAKSQFKTTRGSAPPLRSTRTATPGPLETRLEEVAGQPRLVEPKPEKMGRPAAPPVVRRHMPDPPLLKERVVSDIPDAPAPAEPSYESLPEPRLVDPRSEIMGSPPPAPPAPRPTVDPVVDAARSGGFGKTRVPRQTGVPVVTDTSIDPELRIVEPQPERSGPAPATPPAAPPPEPDLRRVRTGGFQGSLYPPRTPIVPTELTPPPDAPALGPTPRVVTDFAPATDVEHPSGRSAANAKAPRTVQEVLAGEAAPEIDTAGALPGAVTPAEIEAEIARAKAKNDMKAAVLAPKTEPAAEPAAGGLPAQPETLPVPPVQDVSAPPIEVRATEPGEVPPATETTTPEAGTGGTHSLGPNEKVFTSVENIPDRYGFAHDEQGKHYIRAAHAKDVDISRHLMNNGITPEAWKAMDLDAQNAWIKRVNDYNKSLGKDPVTGKVKSAYSLLGKGGPRARDAATGANFIHQTMQEMQQAPPPAEALKNPPASPETLGQTANSLVKETTGNEHTYTLPDVSVDDARLTVVKRGNEHYISDAALPESMRGKGTGQSMYLRAIAENNIREKAVDVASLRKEGWSNRTDVPGPNDITADAYNAIEALKRKGLVTTENGLYRLTEKGKQLVPPPAEALKNPPKVEPKPPVEPEVQPPHKELDSISTGSRDGSIDKAATQFLKKNPDASLEQVSQHLYTKFMKGGKSTYSREAYAGLIKDRAEFQPKPAAAESSGYLQPHELPPAGKKVSGLKVRGDIPNESSIGSSLKNYTVLDGIRDMPLSEFGPDFMKEQGKAPYGFANAADAARVEKLAAEIQASGEIAPLIVVYENGEPYILEGGHRVSALAKLGKTSVPVKVVIDHGEAAPKTAEPAKGAPAKTTPAKTTEAKAEPVKGTGEMDRGELLNASAKAMFDKDFDKLSSDQQSKLVLYQIKYGNPPTMADVEAGRFTKPAAKAKPAPKKETPVKPTLKETPAKTAKGLPADYVKGEFPRDDAAVLHHGTVASEMDAGQLKKLDDFKKEHGRWPTQADAKSGLYPNSIVR